MPTIARASFARPVSIVVNVVELQLISPYAVQVGNVNAAVHVDAIGEIIFNGFLYHSANFDKLFILLYSLRNHINCRIGRVVRNAVY